jgi:plastocyanin
MKKYVIIFNIVVLLMLAGGCTQPAPEQTVQPAATPVPALVLTATPAAIVTSSAVLTTGTVSPTIPNAVSDNTIHINKKGFDPARITVKAGTTVRWVNEDSTTDPALYNPTHRITLANLKNSPLLSPGQSWSWIFTDPGTFDYSDMIHDVAKGTVVVE